MWRFFFQAEDGIRDADVTGVQTCALPISSWTIVVPFPKSGITLKVNHRVMRPVKVGRILRIVNVLMMGLGSSNEKRPSAWATMPRMSLYSPFSNWITKPSDAAEATSGAGSLGFSSLGLS